MRIKEYKGIPKGMGDYKEPDQERENLLKKRELAQIDRLIEEAEIESFLQSYRSFYYPSIYPKE